MFGILNLKKPQGPTSRDLVSDVARLIKGTKVGHAGTLDPLATGVLLVCVGPATRLVPFAQQLEKEYVGRFRLGASSTTEDRDGEISQLDAAPTVTESQLIDLLPRFTGTIQQTPPAFSALKINGKRAHELARQGAKVTLKPREIVIHEIRLTEFDYPDFQLKVRCGSGTYIRSLGRDIGAALGSAAYMESLERTRIGPFASTTGVDPNTLTRKNLESQLHNPMTVVADLDSFVVDKPQIVSLANGTLIELPDSCRENQVIAVDRSERLIAVLERKSGNQFRPAINFAGYWLQT